MVSKAASLCMARRSQVKNLGGENGGGGKAVVDAGVGNVLGEVLNGALAGHNGLDVEAEHGEHGEAAVLDLLGLRSNK